jgi:hypothetical protein
MIEQLGGRVLLSAAVQHEFLPIVPQLRATSPALNVSTVPANGDVNPYGVAFVPSSIATGGALHAGDVLVSNFNNSKNLQGTGTTIVDISSNGKQSLFFQGKGLGLTTALAVLRRGFVLVGNVPTTDGTSATISVGSLLVLDRNGNQVLSLADKYLLDGPWDMTVRDEGPQAVVFISNALSGTVTRLVVAVPHAGQGKVRVTSEVQIASGFTHVPNNAALVLGPTGLAYSVSRDVLFVASTGDNAVYAIDHAGTTTHDQGKGRLIYQDNAHLRGPLGLTLAPNGDLIASNGDAVNDDPNHPSELVEFTRSGQFVAQTPVDSSGEGGAFGIALDYIPDGIRLAAVDDISNTLKVWTIKN